MAINPYEYNYINGRFYSSNVGSKYTPFGSSVSSYYSWAVEFESVKLSGSGILAEHVDSDTDGWRVGINGDRHPYVYWSRNSTYRGTYTFSNLTVSWNTWFYIKFYIYSNSDTPTIRCTLNNSSQNVTVSGRWNNNYDRNLAVGSSTTSIRGVASVKGYAYDSNTLQTATFNLDNISTGATSVTVNGNSFSMPAVAHYSDPAPTVTISLASRTANSLTINATASGTCNKWEYSINNGSTYSQFSTAVATSTSYTITGLSPNTTYDVKVRVTKQSNNLTGVSATGSYTTIGNALLNSVAEVYADASTVIIKPNMTVYGASFTYTLEIKRGNTSILTLSIPAQSTGTKDVSVTLTPAQRTTLLSGMSNVASFSATYILKTLNNGTQVGSTSSATATIRTSSSTSAPGKASFSYADTNAKTVAVTGDSTKLVQGQSTLRLTNLTATAKNGASVASYNITIGGVTKSVTSGGTVEMGVISQSGTLSLSVVVTDTRGYTSTKTVSVTSYAYAPPTISAYSVKRNASTSTQIDMSFSGAFSNIGSNTVTATYKYKQSTAGSYSAETSVTPTISGGTFSYSGTNVATFDDEYVYDFVITLSDGILTESYYMRVPSYEPLIGFRPNSVGFGTVPQQRFNLETSDRWGTHFRGQYNRSEYGSYSFSTEGVSGSIGWVRIATLTFKPTVGTFASVPIRFEVARRYDSRTVNLYLRFAHENNTDPTIESLYFDGGYGALYNNNFNAFAVKTSPGVYDVYVEKDTQWGWIDVKTYIPAFMGYRCTVAYVDNLVATVPANAIMATEMQLISRRKYNRVSYMPYSFNAVGTAGSAGYARIATVTVGSTISAAYTQQTIHFHGIRRTDDTPFNLYFSLFGASSDPPLHAFYADFPINSVSGITPFEAFAYKTAPNTWDIYVRKCSGSDQITIWADVPKYAQDGYTITYSQGHQTSVPSGAVMATALHLTVRTTITLTSGVAQYYNPGITFSSKVTVTQSYVSGGVLGYLFVVQPATGFVNIYTRNPDRTLPPNNTNIDVIISIDN